MRLNYFYYRKGLAYLPFLRTARPSGDVLEMPHRFLTCQKSRVLPLYVCVFFSVVCGVPALLAQQRRPGKFCSHNYISNFTQKASFLTLSLKQLSKKLKSLQRVFINTIKEIMLINIRGKTLWRGCLQDSICGDGTLGNEGNPSLHLGPNLEQGFPLGKIESQLW